MSSSRSPVDRARRLRWLKNAYLTTAIFFPKEGTAEYNRDQIKCLDDLRRFPPAHAVDRLTLGDFDAYLSAEEDAPHGDQAEVQLPNGQSALAMVRRPKQHGFLLANWKDEATGDYMCSWLIGGNDEGLQQVLDIATQRKPQTSFAWRTEFINDPKTGKPVDVRVIPDHIALLGHEGHEPQYPRCRIVSLEPLSRTTNETLPKLREMYVEAKAKQTEAEIERMVDALRQYADSVLETEPVAAVSEEELMDVESAEMLRNALLEDEQQVLAVAAAEPIAAQKVSVAEPESKATTTTTTTELVPTKDKTTQPPPVAAIHHFSLPSSEPSAPLSLAPAVCASSSTFPATPVTVMDANNQQSEPAAAPDAAAQQQQQQQPKKVLTVEELKSKIEGIKKKFQSGEVKFPKFGEGMRLEGPDDGSVALYTSLLNFERDLERQQRIEAEQRAEENAKKFETTNKELENFKAVGETRIKFDQFGTQFNLKDDPAWKEAETNIFGGIGGSSGQAREQSLRGLDQLIEVCSAWKKHARNEPASGSSDAPAAKRQAAFDPDLAYSLQDSVDRVFGSSSSSSSSSGSGSAPAAKSAGSTSTTTSSDLPFDINATDYSEVISYDRERLLDARGMMEKADGLRR